jgi:hypothetical protein
MAEMNEKGNGVAAGTQDAGRRADAAGEAAAELRAEEESAKAMEAEVPHSTGYDDSGQEPPSGSGQEEQPTS